VGLRAVQIRYGDRRGIGTYAVGDRIEFDPEGEESADTRLVVVRGTVNACPWCDPKRDDPNFSDDPELVDVFVERGTITRVRPHDTRYDFMGGYYDYLVVEP
jgi:hypothetical protein